MKKSNSQKSNLTIKKLVQPLLLLVRVDKTTPPDVENNFIDHGGSDEKD